ncbi:hypothetical protein IJJ02_00355 [Candidatus Saccharibacteria bacterium]|nr:hypothetical protein [Candidatus Saccharibacteria bacterium]
MKRIKRGVVNYSKLNTPPEKHERMTANYFADRGFNVVFIKPSSIKGTNSPDFEMDGKIWETKSPIKYSKRSFEDNLKKAVKQSKNVIFDLRRLSKFDEKIYLKELRKWSGLRGVKTLIVITKDGRVLTIKGKFAIIGL